MADGITFFVAREPHPKGSTDQKKATDAELISSYRRTRSIWETAKELGMCGQSVHGRLQKLGVEMDGNGKRWTTDDDKRLLEEYETYRYFGQVSRLAESMGHTIHFLSRKAKDLGLTPTTHPRAPSSKLRRLSEDAIRMIWADYKASPFKMSEYCRRKGFDDEAFANVMKDRFHGEYDDVMESKMTKGTHYCSGRTFEYRVKRHLEGRGFFVMRAPQSKGPVDLIAFHGGRCLLIQCKIGDWYEVDSWNEFYRLAKSHGAEPIFATKVENGRLQLNLINGEKGRSHHAVPMVEVMI